MKPLFADWELSKILLLLLGCFVFGALAFFGLTLFMTPNSQNNQAKNEIIVPDATLTDTQKTEILASLKPTPEQASSTARALGSISVT